MFDGLTIEAMGKFAPVFTTIIATLLIPAILYSVRQFVLVTTTRETDRLYLDKATQVKLRFWDLVLSTVMTTIGYLGMAVIFNLELYDDFKMMNKSVKDWYIGGVLTVNLVLFLVLLLVLFVFPLYTNKTFNFFIRVLLFIHLISSAIIFSHLITYQIFRLLDYDVIPSILCAILCYSCLQNVMIEKAKMRKPPQYIVEIITEEKLENLIYGYALDEKRTLCFIEGIKPDEVFYVCDFSSKVFVKHTKKPEEHVTVTQTASVENNNISAVNNVEHARDI
ncbi:MULTISPECIES: hypothetical protein [Bacillus]|uniref:hypothetical protein n=1 Tax=Bacillus TaxID=1386 RepID=UPI000353B02C|nr:MULTISPECIES: hypothetical protein [Bacillus]EPF03464.1 hypothetical protein ICQ_04861 [Bacillus toyonensis]MBY7134932.1 hypothetical protein [Bacillus sp. 12RED03]MCH5469826.1 hypothetical protein [Bacillus toyonensis]MCU4826997.1 hypothetical protein [Bacillus toyonensis]PGD80290.1 hypothetical protein COM36_20885 [Bacillus toyonensis]